MPRGCPVLLIHGYKDTSRIFRRMRPWLEASGCEVHAIDLVPSDGTIGLDRLAREIQRYVAERFGPGQKVDLVGFSMGGIVARYYVQRLGGAERVRRFITISSPHRGTWTAFASRKTGVRQMRPGSDFLKDLERDVEALAATAFTSIWTPFDLMIVPPASSVLPGARCIAMRVALHPLMVTNRAVLELVLEILAGG